MNTSEKLKQIIADIKKLDPNSISIDDSENFISSLNFQSLEIVNLTVRISKVFNVNFGADINDIDALQQFSSLVAQIERKMVTA